jgi:hypothetical protein
LILEWLVTFALVWVEIGNNDVTKCGFEAQAAAKSGSIQDRWKAFGFV